MKPRMLGLGIAISIVVALGVAALFIRRPLRSAHQPASAETPQIPEVGWHAPRALEQLWVNATGALRHTGPIAAATGVAATPHAAAGTQVEAASEVPLEDPDNIPALVKIALQDADPERRLNAVTLLAASESPKVIPVLAQVLSDRDEDVRMAAIEALADFTGDSPVGALEIALHDPSVDVRYEAVNVLADIGGPRAHNAIAQALNDPDEDVRSLAEGVLDLQQLYEGTPAPGGGQ